MTGEQSKRALARVYDSSDGEHVASLHEEELIPEFQATDAWDVEVL